MIALWMPYNSRTPVLPTHILLNLADHMQRFLFEQLHSDVPFVTNLKSRSCSFLSFIRNCFVERIYDTSLILSSELIFSA